MPTQDNVIKTIFYFMFILAMTYNFYPLWIAACEYSYIIILNDPEPQLLLNITTIYLKTAPVRSTHIQTASNVIASFIVYTCFAKDKSKQLNTAGYVLMTTLGLHLALGIFMSHQFVSIPEYKRFMIFPQSIPRLIDDANEAIKFSSTYLVFILGYLGFLPLKKEFA
ncbi:hypothetical protein N1030_05560 [Desulfovibrio mangrovi]|uniref:hypothetical protein n=1 Tax=Desulfovibrio mangrovi TaxID=2976983 RepID=UPI00224559D9|nr:hypothetical protein [Desulfovibrio mangrovi]UZP68442.1 hypothetical protein N1030_05560 [Desulfovibrio mangrovi]